MMKKVSLGRAHAAATVATSPMTSEDQRRISEHLRVLRSEASAPANEWVAVHPDRGMIAHDPSSEVVIAQVEEENLEPGEVAFSFMAAGLWQ